MARVLILGGYGLIGSACLRALRAAGFDVVGMGRSEVSARAVAPDVDWVIRDIPSVSVEEWRGILDRVDVVVNASGVLQDGARDDVDAIHVAAVERLVAALGPRRLVQISAAGVSPHASTAFFQTKAQGDAVVATAADWVILRPTLVVAPEAYGGTALVRAAAALPLVAPDVLPHAQIQTVAVEDVALAVVAAAEGRVPSGIIADLTEAEARSLPELIAAIRRWQGWPAARVRVPVPRPLLRVIGWAADGVGHLGWRSPLRSTALAVLQDGVRGDPAAWAAAGGAPCRSLAESLAGLPATRQERLFARAFLALPVAVGALALFWVLSGLIALMDVPRAMAILTDRGASSAFAGITVVGGAVADIGLGLAICWRLWARRAALGMVALSGAYLLGSLIFAPDLWADPLGPMVKVIPALVLAVLVSLLLEER
ncbi:MAG: SDR family oxidoreductase [Pseudomonadota bacterium]